MYLLVQMAFLGYSNVCKIVHIIIQQQQLTVLLFPLPLPYPKYNEMILRDSSSL